MRAKVRSLEIVAVGAVAGIGTLLSFLALWMVIAYVGSGLPAILLASGLIALLGAIIYLLLRSDPVFKRHAEDARTSPSTVSKAEIQKLSGNVIRTATFSVSGIVLTTLIANSPRTIKIERNQEKEELHEEELRDIGWKPLPR